MFETDTLRKYFLNVYKKPLKTAVIYDRYTDLLPPGLIKPESLVKPFRLGMLGSLDNSRRDYQVVLDAFSQLPQQQLRHFELVILGECLGGDDNTILHTFQQFIAVDYPMRYLTSDEFDIKGSSCDLLISPLLSKMEYGTFKGSGAIGDAIYLQKNIILPSFADPEEEFSQISYYYSDETELAQIIDSVCQKPARKIDRKFIYNYSSSQVALNIINEIK